MSTSLLSSLGTKTAAAVDPSSRAIFYRSKDVPRSEFVRARRNLHLLLRLLILAFVLMEAAVSGMGIYVTLDDGSVVIDGVGGAAVCSIGNGDERGELEFETFSRLLQPADLSSLRLQFLQS